MKQLLKNTIIAIWPEPLVYRAVAEAKNAARHWRSQSHNRSSFKGKSELLANIGCGEPVPGWVNIDLFNAPGVLFWDCRRSLPFEDGSVALIFAEHVFEHFEYPYETERFLAECLRCLRKDGVLRLVVPDAGRYLKLYTSGFDALAPIRPLVLDGGAYRDTWLGTTYQTPMELINAVFRQGQEHKYAYDAETLMLHLRTAGFSKVLHQSFGVSVAAQPPIDKPERASESLYVEALK